MSGLNASINRKEIKTMCNNCEAVTINGVYCHETGCPDAWMDYKRHCDWCDTEFKPEDRYQRFCDEGCAESYNS